MNKIRNISDLLQHTKSNPEFEIVQKPSTTGKTKLLQYIKNEDAVIVIKMPS